MKEHMLAHADVKKLLIKLSVPATIGMLVMALYNIVDTIFIGQGIGVDAISGVSITFPLHMIVMAISVMFGVGGASVLSRSLGAKDFDKAHKTLGTVVLASLIASVSFSLFMYIFMDDVLTLFGASAQVLPWAREYFRIVNLGIPILVFMIVCNNLVRAEGKAKTAMLTMLLSAVINILLDPLFIFAFHWGIAGAAWATVVSQIAAGAFMLYYITSGRSYIHLKLKDLRIDWHVLKDVCVIGVSSFMRHLAFGLSIVFVNNSLQVHGGDVAIAVMGVNNRFLSVLYMPMFGVGQGLQPIVGYNYGAKEFKKVIDVTRHAILYATLISLVGFVAVMAFPRLILSMFSADPELIRIGVTGLRYSCLALFLVGYQVIGAVFFQAIGKALPSFLLSIQRQIILYIPLLFIMTHYFKLNGVWLAFSVGDFLGFFITFYLFNRELQKFKQAS